MTPTRILASLALLAAALGTAACADREPLSPGTTPEAVAPEGTHGQRLYCTVDVRAGTLACGGVAPSNVRGAIIGGQGQFVKLTSNNVLFDGTTRTLSADVTVQNLLPYALGTRDGTTADSGAVKVFFHTGPVATAGSGAVTVENADGLGVFTATGQPFFRYAAPLAPGQTSESRSWRFHLDAGVTTFAFTLLVQGETQPAAFRIVAPEPGDTIPIDSLAVDVVAGAPPGVSFVRATLNITSRALSYDGAGHWRGKVPARTLSNRTWELRVVAVTPVDSLVQTVPLLFTSGPVLDVVLPLDGTVARPNLRVTGSCTALSTCTLRGYVEDVELPLFKPTGPTFDLSPSMASYEGEERVLYMGATDARGNYAQVGAARRFFVESSTKLVEVGSAGVQVLDVDSTRLLFRDSTAAGPELAVLDVPSGVRTLIHPLRPGGVVTAAYLTPAGAIAALLDANALADSIFELRGGTASFVGPAARYQLRVAGEWAAWHVGTGTLYRRNTTTGFQELVHANGQGGDPAPNGDVAFTSDGYVYWYHGGSTLKLGRGTVPRTDGTQVLYAFKYTTDSFYTIYRHDGATETPIGNPVLDLSNPRYAVNGGWAVFVSLDASSVRQLWSRAPDGTVRQVSHDVGLQVDAVSAAGDVVYPYGTRLFASPPYTSATSVSHIWPSNPVRFHGATAYTAIGRTGFRIIP